MNKQNILTGGVVVAVLLGAIALWNTPAIGPSGTPGTPGTPGSPGLGALPGDTINVPQLKIFSDSPIEIANRATTSTQGAAITLTERDLLYGHINVTANSAITITLPATST